MLPKDSELKKKLVLLKKLIKNLKFNRYIMLVRKIIKEEYYYYNNNSVSLN